MGHLINPIGFRLGVSRHWPDTYFAKKNIYTMILHKIFLFKQIARGVFNISEKQGLVFSHTQVYLFSNVLFIKVHFYDMILGEFIIENAYMLRALIRREINPGFEKNLINKHYN